MQMTLKERQYQGLGVFNRRQCTDAEFQPGNPGYVRPFEPSLPVVPVTKIFMARDSLNCFC